MTMPTMSRSLFRRSTHVLALGALLALAACQGKVQQCNRLIEACNAQQTQMVQMVNGGSLSDPAQLETLATALDTSNQSIAAIALKDSRLIALSTQYRAAVTNMAQTCRAVAQATRAGNAEAAQAAVQQVQAAANANSAVIDQINTYCHQ